MFRVVLEIVENMYGKYDFTTQKRYLEEAVWIMECGLELILIQYVMLF